MKNIRNNLHLSSKSFLESNNLPADKKREND